MRYSDHKYKHGVGWNICHVQWVTKYRYRIFSDSYLKNLCMILLYESARRHRFEIEEAEVQAEHVHVLVKLRPSMSISRAVNLMKGYTSRLLFMLEEEKIGSWYKDTGKERSLWGDIKFYGSVGHILLRINEWTATINNVRPFDYILINFIYFIFVIVLVVFYKIFIKKKNKEVKKNAKKRTNR